MSRKTKADLEREIEKLKATIAEQATQIDSLLNDLELANDSSYFQNLINEKDLEISRYKEESDSVQILKEKYNQMVSAEYWKPSKNERNAGRKTIITESMKEAVKQYRLDGVGYREISDLMGISVGLAHKICNS